MVPAKKKKGKAAKKKKKEVPRVGRPLSVKSQIATLRGTETRRELSERSGVPYRNLTRYETGKGKPYGANAAKLAKALKVPVEKLQ